MEFAINFDKVEVNIPMDDSILRFIKENIIVNIR